MPSQTQECKRCRGVGAFGYEDAPGCYAHEGECRFCQGTGEVIEDVEPCGECSALVSPDALTWAADGRWRCPGCHVRIITKIHAGEHPAYREPSEDMRRTVEMPAVSMRELVFAAVHCGLLVAAVTTWLGVLS